MVIRWAVQRNHTCKTSAYRKILKSASLRQALSGLKATIPPIWLTLALPNLPDGSPVKVKSAMKRVTDFMGKDVNKTGGDVDKQCNEFVTELLQ